MPDIGNEALQSDDTTETPVVEESDAEDVGRTGGGGSLGHDQPETVKRDTPVRNATGAKSDPVMPADDATLNTRI